MSELSKSHPFTSQMDISDFSTPRMLGSIFELYTNALERIDIPKGNALIIHDADDCLRVHFCHQAERDRFDKEILGKETPAVLITVADNGNKPDRYTRLDIGFSQSIDAGKETQNAQQACKAAGLDDYSICINNEAKEIHVFLLEGADTSSFWDAYMNLTAKQDAPAERSRPRSSDYLRLVK